MKLSIVTTLYMSLPFLEKFIHDSIEAIKQLKINDYELIFVNDGSPDTSIDFLIEKQKIIKEIIILDLSRNFGHHHAILAGLSEAKGEKVFLIDSDLEVSPFFLVDCYDEMESTPELDVVYGLQKERKGAFVEKLGGMLFWWLINKFSEVKIPKNITTERLMTKQYVQNLLSMGDANLFLAGMMHWVGFKQKGICTQKGIREGDSTYSTQKRIELMIHAITSFSGKPLAYLFNFGCLITVVSIIASVVVLFKKLFFGAEVQLGWTSILVVNFFILGVLSTAIGLIGIYLFKVYKQVQSRPKYLIKSRLESPVK